MTETQAASSDVIVKTETTTDLVPRQIGGITVPRSVEQLEQLLKATSSNAWPLPFRADILPPDAQLMLRSIGGIPEYVPANYIMLFAGRPYLSADGVIDVAIDQGCTVYTERDLRVLPCLDPQSGCPGEVTKNTYSNGKKTGTRVVKAIDSDRSYIATAHVKKPSGGRFIAYAQCCAHTWQGNAQHRAQMSRTRALRVAAKRALGISSTKSFAEDDPELIEADEIVERVETSDPVPDPVQASAEGGDAGAAAEAAAGEQPVATTPDGRTEAPAPASAGSGKVHIGRLAVDRVGDGPWHCQQEGGGRLRSKEQVAKATELVEQLGLTEGAVDAICKARFGVSLAQASKHALDELVIWLEAQSGAVKAFSGDEPPLDDEPPF